MTAAHPPARIEVPFRVRFDEAAPEGGLRSSGYLRYAQEVAWQHADLAGFDREWSRERGLLWLVRGVELDILSPVEHGTEVRVSTEVVGFRRVWARRRSEFHSGPDERMEALAAIDWVLLGSGGSPVRIPRELEQAFEAPIATFTPARLEPVEPGTDAFRHEFGVRRSDLDPLAHVNNATYLDYFEETLAAAGHADAATQYPRRYRLEYLASAEPDDGLVGTTWEDDLGWAYRLATTDGRELLRARLEVDPGAWVGG